MKVVNTYIVKNDKFSNRDILYECVENRWFLQTEVLQGEWRTVIVEIMEPAAKSMLKSNK